MPCHHTPPRRAAQLTLGEGAECVRALPTAYPKVNESSSIQGMRLSNELLGRLSRPPSQPKPKKDSSPRPSSKAVRVNPHGFPFNSWPPPTSAERGPPSNNNGKHWQSSTTNQNSPDPAPPHHLLHT